MDPSRLTSCFRAGITARDVTCWLTDVANIIRPAGSRKGLTTDGRRALAIAATEARRLQEIMPEARKSAGVVARKAEKWVKELDEYEGKVTVGYIKKFQERFAVLSKNVAQMYSDGLKACGKLVPTDEIVLYLYPDRKRKSIK